MNFKYLDFPFYEDKTDKIQKVLEPTNCIFYVFVHHSDWSQENKELLFKILLAIKLNIKEEVQIFRLKDGQNAHVSADLDFNNNNIRFLAFGLNANRIGLQMKTIPYSIIEIKKLKILFSHKLTDLQANVNYKKQLWGLLQKFQ